MSGDSENLSEKEDGTPVKKDLSGLMSGARDDERVSLENEEVLIKVD